VGRWPDADVVLQGGMSEGLRNWDLWYGSGVEVLEKLPADRRTGVHCFSASSSPSC
jgi:hypothetical protein